MRKSLTKEKCIKTASMCKTKTEWHVKYGSYYLYAKRIGEKFFKKCTKHMVRPAVKVSFSNKPASFWNDESTRLEAQRFQTRGTWYKYSGASYRYAKKKGEEYFKECVIHMGAINGFKKGIWNKKTILEEALKYETSKEWRINSSSSHATAIKYGKGFLRKCSKHFKNPEYPTLWNCNSDILNEARKYHTRCEWHDKSTLSYRTALKSPALFKQCIQHMKLPPNRKKYTDNNVKKEALKYSNLSLWRTNCKGGYSYSTRRGRKFHRECTAHMTKNKDSMGEIISGKILSFLFKKSFKKVKLNNIGEIDRYAVIRVCGKTIKLGLEHQGITHYKYSQHFHRKIDNFHYRLKLDQRKYSAARRKGIVLLRIKDLRNYYGWDSNRIVNRFSFLLTLNRISFDSQRLIKAVDKSLKLRKFI